jgi:hypothetical protein
MRVEVVQNAKLDLNSKWFATCKRFGKGQMILKSCSAFGLIFCRRPSPPPPFSLHRPTPSFSVQPSWPRSNQAGPAATPTHARLNQSLNPAYPVVSIIATLSPHCLSLGRLHVHAALTSCSSRTLFLTHEIGGENRRGSRRNRGFKGSLIPTRNLNQIQTKLNPRSNAALL